jgi:hypothetical protein
MARCAHQDDARVIGNGAACTTRVIPAVISANGGNDVRAGL